MNGDNNNANWYPYASDPVTFGSVFVPADPRKESMTTLGLDLSHYQGFPDFKQVYNAGYRFVIFKAGEGINVIDGSFSTNVPNANRYGFIVSAYHFARPSESSGKVQAEFFLRIIKGYDIASLWLDIEVSAGMRPAELAAWCAEYLATLRAGFKNKVGAYCGQSYAGSIGFALFANNDGKWIASPGYRPGITFNIWQNSWVDKVPSIYGNVDEDEFDGSVDELKVFFGVSNPAPVPTPITVLPDPKSNKSDRPTYTVADFQHLFVDAIRGKDNGNLGKNYLINQALVDVGCKEVADNFLNIWTVRAYAKFQEMLGYSGAAANGIPGSVSFAELTKLTNLWKLG